MALFAFIKGGASCPKDPVPDLKIFRHCQPDESWQREYEYDRPVEKSRKNRFYAGGYPAAPRYRLKKSASWVSICWAMSRRAASRASASDTRVVNWLPITL